MLRFPSRSSILWDHEAGFDGFNVYRGSLSYLKSLGEYTQDLGSTPLAWRACAVPTLFWEDPAAPPPFEAFFYLVTGLSDGVETDLGIDGSGAVRPNAHPCP